MKRNQLPTLAIYDTRDMEGSTVPSIFLVWCSRPLHEVSWDLLIEKRSSYEIDMPTAFWTRCGNVSTAASAAALPHSVPDTILPIQHRAFLRAWDDWNIVGKINYKIVLRCLNR